MILVALKKSTPLLTASRSYVELLNGFLGTNHCTTARAQILRVEILDL